MPVLAFLAVALLAVWLLQAQEGRRERRKALLLASGACVLVIAGLLGWRAIEVKSSGQDEYLPGRTHAPGWWITMICRRFPRNATRQPDGPPPPSNARAVSFFWIPI